jgi:hypothetical protein
MGPTQLHCVVHNLAGILTSIADLTVTEFECASRGAGLKMAHTGRLNPQFSWSISLELGRLPGKCFTVVAPSQSSESLHSGSTIMEDL